MIFIDNKFIKSTDEKYNNKTSKMNNEFSKYRLQIQNKELQLRRGIHRPRESGLCPASRRQPLAKAVFYRFAEAAWCLCDT